MIGIVLWVDSHTSNAQIATYMQFFHLKTRQWSSVKNPSSSFAWKNNRSVFVKGSKLSTRAFIAIELIDRIFFLCAI